VDWVLGVDIAARVHGSHVFLSAAWNPHGDNAVTSRYGPAAHTYIHVVLITAHADGNIL
jgi:hypothetical protein